MKQFNNIREIIENSSVEFKSNTAFKLKRSKNGTVSYDEITYERLRHETEQLGQYLIENNLADKRIAVIGKNSYEWMLVFLAVLSVNGVIVPLDRQLFPEEIKTQLRRAEAEVIFYDPALEKHIDDTEGITGICLEGEEFKRAISEKKDDRIKHLYNSIAIDSDKMSILLFTSGTTSSSKAVMLSQRNIASDVYGMSCWEHFLPTDVNMALLPFHHTFGLTQMVIFMSYGMCNVFCEGLRIAKCLNEYRVTVFVCVPRIIEEIYAAVMRSIVKAGKKRLIDTALRLCAPFGKGLKRRVFGRIINELGGGLRLIIIGAAAAKPEVQKFFNDIGITAVQGYGLTETSPCITAENDTHIRYGSVGKPLPEIGLSVKIAEPDENGIGEIAVKGPNVMLGYYEEPAKTAEVMSDGYFLTGDMGYFDEDGYLFITGRKKNIIVLSNGKNVFPEELEQLLSECEYVKECIVRGEENSARDGITAVIVYDEKYEEEFVRAQLSEFIESMNEGLVSYKQIKSFTLTTVEMEKTTTLKIKRR